ncbi:MAG: ABC transporter permease [Firmicutes bacterium]|nr:ABC transporter permease [Bacillota bacterium]
MSFSDILKMCTDNLKRRKGRTFLTVLGVFIGCTSIIVMVSIGVGMKESQDQMLAEMGDLSVIEVSQQYGSDDAAKLDDVTVETFRNIAGVAAVMPKASLGDFSVSLKAGINDRYYCDWSNIVGLDTDAMEAMGFELIDGKYPAARPDEAVGGQYLAYNFYDSLMPEGYNMVDRWDIYDENGNELEMPEPFFDILKTPVTLEITANDGTESVHRKTMKITGLTKEDYGKGWETSEGIMMSIDNMKALIKDVKGEADPKLTYSTILVKAEDISLVTAIEEEISGLGFYTYSMESMRESMEKSARQVQLMLGGLGAISLFVAAIGITNTMVMSISERTREIGIMKALGCYVKDIRLMFLMEAGSIGLIGGIMGIIFSLIISVGINLVAMGTLSAGLTGQAFVDALLGGEGITRISVISPGLILFAIAFSIFVGVASGYYPANKAVKISALEAIKRE